MENKLEKFLNEANENPSPWIQEALEREANAHWQDRSKRIGLRILRSLRESGLTQKELAEKLSVAPQQVNKWVKGNENLTLGTISKIETALGIILIEVQVKKAPIVASFEILLAPKPKMSFDWIDSTTANALLFSEEGNSEEGNYVIPKIA